MTARAFRRTATTETAICLQSAATLVRVRDTRGTASPGFQKAGAAALGRRWRNYGSEPACDEQRVGVPVKSDGRASLATGCRSAAASRAAQRTAAQLRNNAAAARRKIHGKSAVPTDRPHTVTPQEGLFSASCIAILYSPHSKRRNSEWAGGNHRADRS